MSDGKSLREHVAEFVGEISEEFKWDIAAELVKQLGWMVRCPDCFGSGYAKVQKPGHRCCSTCNGDGFTTEPVKSEGS